MSFRWRSLAQVPDPTGGIHVSVLWGMLRTLLKICCRAGPSFHRDSVMALVEKIYNEEI